MITKNEIQLVRALNDKRNRDSEGLFVAEGEKLVGEILRTNLHVHRLYTRESLFAEEQAVQVTAHEMERLSLLKTPTSALAVVEIPHYRIDNATLRKQLVLALDEVQNPGNLGTIIRIADWFGIEHILCSRGTADCFNPKVVQATMGAILRVNIHYCDLDAYLRTEHQVGTPIYGTFLEGENIYQAPLTSTGIILMGNEGRGVTPATAQSVSHKLLIPPYPADRRSSESLNVAIATGIVCAEFRRRC